MLIYHPALDPYHCAFRLLQLLAYDPDRRYDARALRILDFYAVFPRQISAIRLPASCGKWKRRFSETENPYWFTGEPGLIFARMGPLQETALDLLYAQGLTDAAAHAEARVNLVKARFQKMTLPEAASQPKDLLEFLVTVLGALAFHGPGGLKDRTGLLEYRYDAV